LIGGKTEIWEAFHGSPSAEKIAEEGFDVSFSGKFNMFGRGIYVAPQSSKANQYTFGANQGCKKHGDKACRRCTRQMLICLCIMGKQFDPDAPTRNVPQGFHSVVADPTKNSKIREQHYLRYPEFVLLHGHQVCD